MANKYDLKLFNILKLLLLLILKIKKYLYIITLLLSVLHLILKMYISFFFVCNNI